MRMRCFTPLTLLSPCSYSVFTVMSIHIPAKITGDDPITIHLQAAIDNVLVVVPYMKSGALRPLAVTAAQRVPGLEAVPAVAETMPGFELVGWFGFMVPTGTPKAVIAKVHADTVKALANADLRKRITEIGMTAVGNTSG